MTSTLSLFTVVSAMMIQVNFPDETLSNILLVVLFYTNMLLSACFVFKNRYSVFGKCSCTGKANTRETRTEGQYRNRQHVITPDRFVSRTDEGESCVARINFSSFSLLCDLLYLLHRIFHSILFGASLRKAHWAWKPKLTINWKFRNSLSRLSLRESSHYRSKAKQEAYDVYGKSALNPSVYTLSAG